MDFMSSESGAITHVSDTALLVAGCRAIEATRPDALVRDPFVGRLAGERGLAMFRRLQHPEIMLFGMAIRTRFVDELVLEALAAGGVGTVVCVGAGLDTRPWRLDLPSELRWIEVDFAAMLDFKDRLLADEKPRCRRERLEADVNDAAQRKRIYAAVGRAPALMITEGLLMYLPARTVESLASEAARESGIAHWICDIMTTTFSQAIGGGGTKLVRHVQADDHLTGEQTLETIFSRGWKPMARRSYVSDLGFAEERIKSMMPGVPSPEKPPAFGPDEQAGVHRFSFGS
jgi:methyltransferase (TIGR00027 family)